MATAQAHSIFDRWGHTAFRRRRLILLTAVLVAVIGGAWGTSIFAKVQTAGGFDAPDSQSQHEATLATQAFGRDAGDVVVLYSSKTLTTASPTFRSAVTATLAALPHGQAESYASYWSTGSRQFVSASGHQTYAAIELTGATDTARQSGRPPRPATTTSAGSSRSPCRVLRAAPTLGGPPGSHDHRSHPAPAAAAISTAGSACPAPPAAPCRPRAPARPPARGRPGRAQRQRAAG